MNAKLSPAMIDALDTLRERRSLIRYAGGYWAPKNASLDRDGRPIFGHFGTRTIDALIDRGLARVTNWRDGEPSDDANNYPVRVEPT